MNVLVIAAHPDDEVLGCGGTMAKMSQNGHYIYCLILGEGITSRNSFDLDQVNKLRENALEAHKILRVEHTYFENTPDNAFDSVPLLRIIKSIEKVKAEVNPDIVFTQHGGDLNNDHTIIFRATLTAFRPQPSELTQAVYAYEVASSTEWAFQQFEPRFQPNHFEDITRTAVQKMQALRCYEGELRTETHPRSEYGVTNMMQIRGQQIGVRWAEAFQLIWSKG